MGGISKLEHVWSRWEMRCGKPGSQPSGPREGTAYLPTLGFLFLNKVPQFNLRHGLQMNNSKGPYQ